MRLSAKCNARSNASSSGSTNVESTKGTIVDAHPDLAPARKTSPLASSQGKSVGVSSGISQAPPGDLSKMSISCSQPPSLAGKLSGSGIGKHPDTTATESLGVHIPSNEEPSLDAEDAAASTRSAVARARASARSSGPQKSLSSASRGGETHPELPVSEFRKRSASD